MKVTNLLTQDMVISDLQNSERDSALREMTIFLKKKNKISKEKDLYEKLRHREELGSTAIGNGVAIPHCKIKSVEEPIVMLAVSKKGVSFFSLDGSPSHIFFLVVSSSENPSLNLQILAAIAHLVRKADTLLKRIITADDIPAIVEIIREEEDKINE